MIHATTFLALNQTSHLYVFRSKDSKCFESQIYQILCINFMHFMQFKVRLQSIGNIEQNKIKDKSLCFSY